MKIVPHILKDEPSMKSSSWSLFPMYPIQIQYYVTKRNLLSLRLTAVILTTLSWLIMLVICIHPRWITLENSRKELWQNITLNFALWDNCVQCLNPNDLSVYLFLSRGIIFLNLVFTSLLILSMICSFRRIFSRVSRLDFVFSIANYVSGLALFLCIMLFGLQVLEIFIEEGWTFHFQWPFYLSGLGILSFIVAGTICLKSHKYTWNISYLSPKDLFAKSEKQKRCGSSWQQSTASVIPQERTTSSAVINQDISITSILNS
uniref:Transmembrane protein 225-like isoform X1 n=1 Tax=Phascolarctos cinereus TaxID=38626 RepID=A0A6P5IPR2_PHACI|nr:transmembrane protein 225-like isoform X1 [Phascolarctos cinereus]